MTSGHFPKRAFHRTWLSNALFKTASRGKIVQHPKWLSLPETRLGSYEIIALIGAGGMGEFYRAHDARLGRDVAVKVLPEHLSKDPHALARFVSENKAVAALSHPNILAIFDTGTENGASYAVTELLEGKTLRSLLARARCPGARPWRLGSIP